MEGTVVALIGIGKVLAEDTCYEAKNRTYRLTPCGREEGNTGQGDANESR